MMQPTRVLPSNAPPLREGEEVQHVSRVLQEHSGNRQQSDYKFNVHDQQHYVAGQHKYHGPVLSENIYPHTHHHVQQQAPPPPPPPQVYQPVPALYHPQPQHRHSFRYGYHRGGFRHPHDQERIHLESDRLFHRFRQSEMYLKYRNRQTKDDKGNAEQKWPDDLERAFFRALVQYPPMGRRKQLHKDKQRGRNELIADCIEELTGVSRTRKQVSSHIQVLKPFVEQDPHIMKWLSKDDMCAPSGRYHGHPSAFSSGRRLSNFPVTAPPPMVCTAVPPMARPENHGVQKLKQSLDAFEPTEFHMFIQRKFKTATPDDAAATERLHTYTQSLPNPLGKDLTINDWQTIERDFPLLFLMNNRRPLDCTVLVANASLALSVEKWKDREGSSVELGIWFLCSSRHFPPTPPETRSQVRIRNTFYDHGNCVTGDSGPIDVEFYRPAGRDGCVETHIKFGSSFWARTLGNLATRHREAADGSQEQKDSVAASIRGITAVQEIFAISELGVDERISVIHWTFRQSSCTQGQATWRKLILPSSHQMPYADGSLSAKTERVDSLYEFEAHTADHTVPAAPPQATQQAHHYPQNGLQSPFEYNDNSSSHSAPTSNTWPASLGDTSAVVHPTSGDLSADSSFDFNSLNVAAAAAAYCSNFNFDHFDSSAFTFDPAVDFSADPTLQSYSQSWCDPGYAAFDDSAQSQVSTLGNSFASVTTAGGGGGVHRDELDAAQHHQHHQHHPHHAAAQQQQQMYSGFPASSYEQQLFGAGNVSAAHHDQQQAFGGAAGPQDMIKEEDAMAVLADASFLARSMRTN